MAHYRKEMIEWVLGEIAGSEGLSIKDLFKRFSASFVDEDPEKVWRDILASDTIDLSSPALKKLALGDILELGLGENQVRARRQLPADAQDAVPANSASVNDGQESTIITEFTATGGDAPSAPDGAVVAHPVKRRGRPPRAQSKKATQNSATVSHSVQPSKPNSKPRFPRPALTAPRRISRSSSLASIELHGPTQVDDGALVLPSTSWGHPVDQQEHIPPFAGRRIDQAKADDFRPNPSTSSTNLVSTTPATEVTDFINKTVHVARGKHGVSNPQRTERNAEIDPKGVEEDAIGILPRERQNGPISTSLVSDVFAPKPPLQTVPQASEHDRLLLSHEVSSSVTLFKQLPETDTPFISAHNSDGFSLSSHQSPTEDDEDRSQIFKQVIEKGERTRNDSSTTTAVEDSRKRRQKPNLNGLAQKTSSRAAGSRAARPRFHPAARTPVKRSKNELFEAQFISHDQMEYEKGISRAYIDLPGTEKPAELRRGRRSLSLIALIKSDKLRDPDWLEKRKGSWFEFVTGKVSAYQILLDDASNAKKRKVGEDADTSLNSLPNLGKRKRANESDIATGRNEESSPLKKWAPRTRMAQDAKPSSQAPDTHGQEHLREPESTAPVLAFERLKPASRPTYKSPYAPIGPISMVPCRPPEPVYSMQRALLPRTDGSAVLHKLQPASSLHSFSAIPLNKEDTITGLHSLSSIIQSTSNLADTGRPAYQSPYTTTNELAESRAQVYMSTFSQAPTWLQDGPVHISPYSNADHPRSLPPRQAQSTVQASERQSISKPDGPQDEALMFQEEKANGSLRRHSDIQPAGSHCAQKWPSNDVTGLESAPKLGFVEKRRNDEIALAAASAVIVSEGVSQLASFFASNVGNLLLSEDKSTLEFFALSQHPPETAQLTLEVSRITQNPISSMPGSKPMELRIKAQQRDGASLETYKFRVASTPSASDVLNNMRAKIVTAMIAHRFRSTTKQQEASLEIIKPFKCLLCNSRFKNKGGLDYHVTKANTTCNPNYDPEAKRRYVRKQPPLVAKPTLAGSKAARDIPTIMDVMTEPEVDSGSSSEDSILEWAEQNATDGLSKGPKAPPIATGSSPKVYRSLPGEKSVLAGIAKDKTIIRPINRSNTTKSTRLTGNRCEEILLSLSRSNNGLFPGDRSIWIAFVAVWLREGLEPDILPETKLCNKTLDTLVSAKKLNLITFSFCNNVGKDCQRTIITTPEFDLTSPTLPMMQELIKISHPGHYVPSQFAPPQNILFKLENIASCKAISIQRGLEYGDNPFYKRETESGPGACLDFESSDKDFTFEEQLDIESESEFDCDDASESEVDLVDEERDQPFITSVAQGNLKCRGSHVPHAINNISRDPLRLKEERAQRVALELQFWNTLRTFLPNPTTGAWNMSPAKQVVPRNYRNHLLPEPITFMQADDGSWSQRPFGHGARPIFARPARRADGNPNLETYLKKLGSGHRPVIMPSRNRIFLPAMPSKKLLQPEAKATPRRQRGRKSPITPASESLDIESLYDIDSRPQPTASFNMGSSHAGPFKRQTRNSLKAAGTYLKGVQSSDPYEPKKLAPGVHNEALDSLPSTFGLRFAESTGAADTAMVSYDTIQFVEPKLFEVESDLSEGSWTAANQKITNLHDFRVTWDEETAFSVETLPYDQFGANTAEVETEMEPILPSKSKRKYTRKSVSNVTSIVKPPQSDKAAKVRPMVAFTSDFEGVVEDTKIAEAQFGVQVTEPLDVNQARKRYRGDAMSPILETRFIASVVIIRTLTGGIESQADWVLLSTIFPSFSVHYLAKFWTTIYSKQATVIDHLTRDFQAVFPLAYESGQIPPLDYDHLVEYNWHSLIDWFLANIDTSPANKPIRLPETRQEAERIYEFTDVDRNDNNVQEMFFGLFNPVHKRVEAAAGLPKACAVFPEPDSARSSSKKVDDMAVAKSWVRATALTPAEDWNADIAKSKLNSLGTIVVDNALSELTESKVIMHRSQGRAGGGRSYEATDMFSAPFRKQVLPQVYLEAVTFKSFLDEAFQRSEPCVRVDYMANEGSMMCMTSLLAAERVRLQGVDLPMNKWGLGNVESGYETKKIPKSRYRFEMDIYPTATYLFDNDNDTLSRVGSIEPPQGSQRGELPVWYDISGNLMKELWKKVVVAVAGAVALRAGISIKGLKAIFTSTMEEWDIALLMNWGVQMELFSRVDPEVDGWTVPEWWWAIVGRVCNT